MTSSSSARVFTASPWRGCSASLGSSLAFATTASISVESVQVTTVSVSGASAPISERRLALPDSVGSVRGVDCVGTDDGSVATSGTGLRLRSCLERARTESTRSRTAGSRKGTPNTVQ